MTVLKWLVVSRIGRLSRRACRSLSQAARFSSFRYRGPWRTAPEAAGFPEAEEHVLTTADGEKVIIWHVPAKPGHPVVIYFPGNGDFLAGAVGRLRAITSGGIGPRRAVLPWLCRLERPAQRERTVAGCRGGLTISLRRDTARSELSSGAFHSAPGLLSPSAAETTGLRS